LELRCDAAPFEELRDAADAYKQEHGRAPRVCLATIGEFAEHNARSTFARKVFAVGGFESIDLATAEPGEGEDAVAVCICGTDEAYADYGADLLYTLRDLGATHVLLAGNPEKLDKDTKRKFKKLKLSGSIYQGCDVLAVLRQLHAALRKEPAFLELQA
jgi:methylmalonyl-CoA mutase